MKFTLLSFFLLFSLTIVAQEDYYEKNHIRYDDYVYKDNIATVQLLKYNYDAALDFPTIQLGTEEKLLLTFDDLTSNTIGYMYKLQLCNSDWTPSQLMQMEYIQGLTEMFCNQSRYSFNTTKRYSHYEVVLPSNQMKITKSGNYLLIVYPEGEENNPIITRRFFVFENKVNVEANVRLATTPQKRLTHQELYLVVDKLNYDMPDPYSFLTVVIQQNGRKDNIKTLKRPRNVNGNKISYSYLDDIVFAAGNEFRKLDIRSFRVNTGRVQTIDWDTNGFHLHIMPDPLRMTLNYVFIPDINGRFQIINWDDPHLSSMIESDYGYVHLTLPVNSYASDGEYYVMGEFTNWRFDPKYKLQYNPAKNSYEATLLLKQAYYDYAYVFLPNGSKVAKTNVTEGNHSATENEYHIFVYYRDPGEIYDRLINLSTVSSSQGN